MARQLSRVSHENVLDQRGGPGEREDHVRAAMYSGDGVCMSVGSAWLRWRSKGRRLEINGEQCVDGGAMPGSGNMVSGVHGPRCRAPALAG